MTPERFARINQMLDRLTLQQLNQAVVLQQDQELALAGKLVQFTEVVQSVAKRGMPNMLCSYLFELAGLFSTFYEACPVLTAESDEIKQSRLKLSLLTARVLKQGLQLLGIETLERM